MSWSFWLLLVPTVAYALAAIAYGLQDRWPLCVIFSGYAFSNLGFLYIDIMGWK
jgi:uncharacterized protein involved in cysteine biosynthesis